MKKAAIDTGVGDSKHQRVDRVFSGDSVSRRFRSDSPTISRVPTGVRRQ